MIARRTLLGGAAAALLARPRRAGAQTAAKLSRVGVLRPAPDDARFQRDFEGFREALREGGYVEGRSVVLDYRMRPGPAETIEAMARELVGLPVDVLTAIAPPRWRRPCGRPARCRSWPSIWRPTPLALGLAQSLARPGGNVTGVFLDFPDRPHLRSMFGQAGRHVVRVLRGTPPREIPMERPAQFSLLINQRTAQALGLTIPAALLARADEVVQR
jgi:putative ABC transport system substrate-binding protein